MTAIQAVFDGKVFIPENPCDITRGSKVKLTIETVNNNHSEKHKKLAVFRQLTKEIKELNKTDPLPKDFDEILSQRVRFREFGNF
jgi:predicted DNA-binding antitoxin AbrB/MazE fold protein